MGAVAASRSCRSQLPCSTAGLSAKLQSARQLCTISPVSLDSLFPTQAPGFQWVDEKKPHHLTHKWGFVATEPEASLVFTVNTAMTTQTVRASIHLR